MSDKIFVSEWLVNEVSAYYAEYGVPDTAQKIKRANEYFYRKYPEVSQRTIRTATYAVRVNEYRIVSTQPHYMAMPVSGIVPAQFSDYNEYIERMKGLITKCASSHRRIRVANIQDGHRETADPAVFNLVLKVLDDFDPDYVPQMCDMVDNTLFAPYTHGTSYMQSNISITGDNSGMSAVSHAMKAFEFGSLEWARNVREVVRKETLLPVWLGNHEVWILRYLQERQEAAGYFFENFFGKLKALDVLWTEGDTRKELPLTDNVFAIHGWASGNQPGATAMKYMRHYDSQISLFAGHSHRQETLWSKPNINTGGQNFINICGTLGTTRPDYRQQGYTGHNLGFSLAWIAPEGNIGHTVEDIRIGYANGYYRCYYNGELYQEKATREPEFTNPFTRPLTASW